jgi:hypothetical protein
VIARLAGAGAVALCILVVAYSAFVMFVGTTYQVCEQTLGQSQLDCSLKLVPIPVAVVPLVLAALVAVGILVRNILLGAVGLIGLFVFGFLTGLSIGAPVFIAAILIVIALLVAALSSGRRTA